MSPTRRVIPLDQNWTFKQADNDNSDYLPVSQFPTNVHLDLIHHKVIADPFIGKNENDVQWIGEKAWIYKTTFASPAVTHGKAVLAFDGLDTHATVVLNGKEILKTENMFVPERVDVTDLLASSEENHLEITFESTYLIGKKLVEQHPEHRWGGWNGDLSRFAVRKAQYHYGWDWGPTLLTCGPWRPVSLELYSSRIADLYFRQDVRQDLKSVKVHANADVEGNATHVKFDLSLDKTSYASQVVEVEKGLAAATLEISNPELWYPATYGKQPLYTLTATLLYDKQELDTTTKRIGLRRANLVQRALEDAPGTSFFFEVNNIPIFCGGSDWIPADNFIPRISSQRYRDWVKLAVEGNQVMIRVWGGGIFEEKAFYEACDEFGVLVWHDFLFGCGNYPTFPEILDSIKREAVANVKLLRHHPSIVIWAGNNEDYQYQEEQQLEYNRKDTNPENWLKTNFPARYIYEKLLVDVTKELVPDTYYHFGSPYGGKDTRDPTVGDIHQWNVWHGTQEKYQNWDKLGGRFVSEFGMEGFPNIRTIDAYLPKAKSDPDRYPQSSTVDFHNKADGHERRIALYLVENMQYTFNPIEQYIYCTQLMQAECLGSAYRLWRRDWKGPGREYCAGALVWQLNDCWPVTSWAIVDYYLRPKLAYYAVKREMAPFNVGVKRTTATIPKDKYTRAFVTKVNKLEIWAGNLSLEDKNITVSLKAFDLVTSKQTYTAKLAENTPLISNRTTEVSTIDVPVPEDAANSPDVDYRTVVAVYVTDVDSGAQLARYVSWPEPLKYAHLQKPKALTVSVADDLRSVEISADVPVKGVALELKANVSDEVADKVVWDDNGIDLVPGETVRVAVRGLNSPGDVEVRYLGSA